MYVRMAKGRRLSDLERLEIVRETKKGVSVQSLARQFGVTPRTIQYTVHREKHRRRDSAIRTRQVSATVTPEKLRDFDAVLGRQGSGSGANGSSGTPKFEDEPEFAAKQLELLDAELANGAALVQRREDGMYVKRVIDGEDIELGFSDELSGLKHEQ